MRSIRALIPMVLMMLVAAGCGSAVPAGPSTCEFRAVSAGWTGTCSPLFDRTPGTTTLESANVTAAGTWRKALPTKVWVGDIAHRRLVNARIELDMYRDATGVLRTAFGWFPASGISTGSSMLRFKVDTTRTVAPSGLDRQIVQRASAILATDAAWDRAGGRTCLAGARSWSIYCAMMQAMVDVTGASNDQRPAMLLVRQAIDARTEGRKYRSRIIGYNNDPSTRLADVHSLFAQILARTTFVQ